MIRSETLTRFEDYIRYERRFSEHTVESYSRDVLQFTDFLDLQYGSIAFGKVTHHHIRSWVVSLLQSGRKPASLRRKISSISHFFKWLKREKMVEVNPVIRVQLPKIPARLPKSLPENIVNRLWEDLAGTEADYPLLRDRTLIALLDGSGLRRSEVIQLTWGDFDPGRKTLKVFGKGRKHRIVPLNDALDKCLQELKNKVQSTGGSADDIQIILMDNGKPCYPKYVHNRVVSLLGTVTTAEKRSPHVLRHSMATHLMDHGAELNAVKGLLGHASLAATQIYTHNSIARLKEVYHQAHPKSMKS